MARMKELDTANNLFNTFVKVMDKDLSEMRQEEDEEIKDMLASLSSAYRSVEDVAAIADQKHCKQMLSDACEKINSVCTKLEEKLS
tara:strand:+ start:113 stop:370 length:258 start_codon:yes stop_codon:yes gene_type:complete